MRINIKNGFKEIINAFVKPESEPINTDNEDKFIEDSIHNYIDPDNISSHSYYRKPDRLYIGGTNERSIMTSIYNRIALDVASSKIKHCKLDDKGRFLNEINSELNNRLNKYANIDQVSRAFIQDVVISMFDEGCVAIVPVTVNIDENGETEILSLRVGRIKEWFPTKVRIELYNDINGLKEEIILDKNYVGIIENPFYMIMNEHSSTLKRLAHKLRLLDLIDEQSGSSKLDLIIQLPYSTRSEIKQTQAQSRRNQLEEQLTNSKYGIGYIDGTEKIIQLNRPIENNLMGQIEYLTNILYSQLNMTDSILNGTANETTMLNYYSRTVEPIIAVIVDELNRKFLDTKDNESLLYFRNTFSLVPVKELSELGDKFTRNEILTSNEMRQIIGFAPSDDPKADKLVNSNLNQPIDKTINNKEQEDKDER